MARTELSAEYVNDSTSESEGNVSIEEEPSNVHSGALVHPDSDPRQKSRAASEESSVSVSSDETSESEDDTQQSRPMPNGIKRKQDSDTSFPNNKRSKPSPAHVPTRAYIPPSGFLPISSAAPQSTLATSDLSGKQIWHITAPSTVSLNGIESLDLQAALRGEPILERDGVKYNMQVTAGSPEVVMLPMPLSVSTGNGTETTVAYECVAMPISKTLHLHEMTQSSSKQEPRAKSDPLSRNPQSCTGVYHIDFFAREKGTSRPARQQPKNLLMRYHPFGSGSIVREKMPNPDGNEESPTNDEPADSLNKSVTFSVPGELSSDEMDVDEAIQIPERKKKQKGGRHEAHQDGLENDQPEAMVKNKIGKKPEPETSHLNYPKAGKSGRIVESPKKRKEKKEKHRKKEKTKVLE